jgi:hypothetical protein
MITIQTPETWPKSGITAGCIQAEGLDSKSAADVQPRLPMHSKSYTGSSAASIDVSDGIRCGRKWAPGRAPDLPPAVLAPVFPATLAGWM